MILSTWSVLSSGIVRTFDCGVIFVDEMALDELDREAGFTHTSSSNYDELVFPEKLMQGKHESVWTKPVEE